MGSSNASVGIVGHLALYQTEAEIRRLVRGLEHAYAFRRFDIIEPLAAALSMAPVHDCVQGIGHYFTGLVRLNHGDLAEAHRLFENAATIAAGPFSSRAILSIGAVGDRAGDENLQRRAYGDAARSSDSLTLLVTHRMIAVLQARAGDHSGSLDTLERLFEFARATSQRHPLSYYEYLNSLAVEMAEVGRLEEADNVSRVVLASPLARLYPECHQTRTEIEARGRRASRSLVAIERSIGADNVLQFRPSTSSRPSRASVPGRLISLEQAMVKKKYEGATPSDFSELPEREKRLALAVQLLKEAPGANFTELFSTIPPSEQSRILVDAALSHASEETMIQLYERLLASRKEESK